MKCSGEERYGGDVGEKKNLLTKVKVIFQTYGAFAAMKEDGTVVVWGNSLYGGDAGDKQSELVDIIHLAKAKESFAAQQAGGKEIVWGNGLFHKSALTNLRKLVTHGSLDK